MRALARLFLALSLLLAAGAPASADPVQLQILALYPEADATLRPNRPLYARVRYRAEAPIRIQGRGYLGGEERHGSTYASPLYLAGEGEALAWIAFAGGAIDEIRVQVHDRNWKLLAEESERVFVRWGAAGSASEAGAPAWVQTLRAEQQRALAAAARARSDDGISDAGLNLLILMIAWSVPGYALLQVYALRKFETGWRRLAKFPLWFMLPAIAVSLYALLQESNLWPIWLLLASPFAFVYLVALIFAWRRSSVRQAAL